jgi:hypothetical protein
MYRHGWSGLLVEPIYLPYRRLRNLNRRTWSGKEPVYDYLIINSFLFHISMRKVKDNAVEERQRHCHSYL